MGDPSERQEVTTPAPGATAEGTGGGAAFALRKLHSLTGVVPVGAFLLLHLWSTASALGGRAAFDDGFANGRGTPYGPLVEVLVLGLPLTFHALYGVRLVLLTRPNVGRYPTGANWAHLFQRITGLLALAFIAYHTWQFRGRVALGQLSRADYYPELCSELSSTVGPGVPLMALLYLVGTAACVYHFTNGLHGFLFSWGITRTARAHRTAGAFLGAVAVVLFLLGANTIIYFATGSRWTFGWADDGAPGATLDAPAALADGRLRLTCKDLAPREARP